MDGIQPNTHGGRDFGNYIIIASEINGKTYWILYAHLNSINVTTGEIAAGQKIGQIGKTGNASDERNTDPYGILTPVNPHVHMEFRVFEEGVNFNDLGTENPENFFNTKFDQQGNPIKNENCL